jgi:hypothetical protein
MDLRLSPEEAELMREILSERQGEMFRQISRTQHRDFKTTLRQKESLLDSVVHKLDVLLEESRVAFGTDPTLG